MSGATTDHPIRDFARPSVALMLQVAMEKQVEEFLGQSHYSRGDRRRAGWRNGSSARIIKSEAGPLGVLPAEGSRDPCDSANQALKSAPRRVTLIDDEKDRPLSHGVSIGR